MAVKKFSATFMIVFAILNFSTFSPSELYTDFDNSASLFTRFRGYSFTSSKFDISSHKKLLIDVLVMWLCILLLLSGDVELNPGPPKIVCRCCNKTVSHSIITCGFCDQNFHHSCVNLTDDDAKVFIDSNRMYICDVCTPVAKRYFRLEQRIEKCEQKLCTIDKKLDGVISTLDDLKATATSNFSQNSSDLSKQFADFYELESKKRNAVLFGLPPTDDDIGAIRALVKNTTVKPTDILYTFRDGPDHDKKGKSIVQFNKVVFCTSKARNDFLAIVRRWKDNDLRARPDLTFAQREANRKLRAELADRFDQGETHIRIDYKTGKIVRGDNMRVTRSNSTFHH